MVLVFVVSLWTSFPSLRGASPLISHRADLETPLDRNLRQFMAEDRMNSMETIMIDNDSGQRIDNVSGDSEFSDPSLFSIRHLWSPTGTFDSVTDHTHRHLGSGGCCFLILFVGLIASAVTVAVLVYARVIH